MINLKIGAIVQTSKKEKKVWRAAQSILSKHDITFIRKDIPMLENGRTTKYIVTERTCAFDSIYIVFGVIDIFSISFGNRNEA